MTITSPKTLTVTQPFLPPLEEFIPYLEKIWDSKILTNGGPFHQQLEEELVRIPRCRAHRAVHQRHDSARSPHCRRCASPGR